MLSSWYPEFVHIHVFIATTNSYHFTSASAVHFGIFRTENDTLSANVKDLIVLFDRSSKDLHVCVNPVVFS